MATKNDVNLTVGVDASDAEKSLENFRKTSTASLTAIEKGFASMRTAAVAAVAAFAAKNVFDFFKSGIDSASEAEVAFGKMAKALELSGNAAPGAAEAFDQLANNIERVTGISAESVQEQIAVAQAFELTNAETQKLIIAATELSAATGKDLATSVRDLGNTFNGTIGSLKKTLPELQSLDENALKAGEALDYVISRFSGSAAKNLETFSGSVEQVGIAFGKIPEAFGEVIVQSDAIRKALSVITETFYGLASIVTGNQSAMSNLITIALDPLMGALSAAVRIIGIFNNAINGIQLAVLSLGKVFLDTVAFAKEFSAEIAKFTFGGRQYDQAAKSAAEAKQTAEEYTKTLQLMNDQLISEKKTFDDLNDRILNYKDATDDTSKAIKSLSIAEGNASKQRRRTAEDIAKVSKSYEDLAKKIEGDTIDALDKQLAAFESYLDDIDQLRKDGFNDEEKLNRLRESLIKNHERNVTEIVKKQAEDRKKEVQAIVGETSFFAQVKLALAAGTADDLRAEIKKNLGTVLANVGAGFVSSVAQGEKGFTNLVTNLVRAIPVFGNLIAAAVELGTLTPEENEKAIKGFADGVVKSMDNFNTNLGRLPDILSEVAGPLIEKLLGPLFANFISNLMKSLSAWPKLVPVIAKGVAHGLRAMGGIMSEAFKKAIQDTGMEGLRFYGNAERFFNTFADQVKGAFGFVFANNPLLTELKTMNQGQKLLTGIVQFFSNAFQAVPGILISIRDAFVNIGTQFAGAFENLGAKISDGFIQIRDGFANLFTSLIDAVKALPKQIETGFSRLVNGFADAIKNIFASFFATFQSLAEKIRNFVGGGTASLGGSGKKGPVTGIPGSPLATGLTEVPRGYSDDSFLARLSSGERVVDPNTNADLKSFLENANGGGLGNAEMVALLRQIAASLGTPRPITIQVDKKVLGRTMLDMSRRNERTTA